MARMIDADALMDVIRQHEYRLATKQGSIDYGMFTLGIQQAVDEQPTVDAVPVSELEKLRDYLYAEDLIFMRGLAELNKLIANCGAKMDGGEQMTHEEAKNILLTFIGKLVRGRKSGKSMLENRQFEAFAKAIEALEKQIPKKPYWEYGVWHCKSCGLDVFRDDFFCPICGQEIDWEDDE